MQLNSRTRRLTEKKKRNEVLLAALRRKQFPLLGRISKMERCLGVISQAGCIYAPNLPSSQRCDKVAEPVPRLNGEESEEEPGACPLITSRNSPPSSLRALRSGESRSRHGGLLAWGSWLCECCSLSLVSFCCSRFFSPCNPFLPLCLPDVAGLSRGRGTVRLFLPPVSLVLRIYSIMLAAPSVSIKHVSVQCLGFKPAGSQDHTNGYLWACEFLGRPRT